MTSIYLGLKGSYAYKEYRLGWADSERSVPTRHLYLNIVNTLEDQEDGRVYEFSFLKDSDTQKVDLYDKKWFRVGKILDLSNIGDFTDYVSDKGLEKFSRGVLSRLSPSCFHGEGHQLLPRKGTGPQ